jgi:hypothetical protein
VRKEKQKKLEKKQETKGGIDGPSEGEGGGGDGGGKATPKRTSLTAVRAALRALSPSKKRTTPRGMSGEKAEMKARKEKEAELDRRYEAMFHDALSAEAGASF